jgi:hypothetical protein
MKKFPQPFLLAALATGLAWASGATASAADTKAPPATKAIPEKKAAISTGFGNIPSVFVLPTSVRDGRDPFYPESVRAVENAMATAHTVEITSLKVPGVSGTPGHLFAIINNHTFAVGEEGDVKTAGGPVHLRCVEIQNNVVIVEINGQLHRLNVEP